MPTIRLPNPPGLQPKNYDELPEFCVDEGKDLRIAIIGGGFSGILAAIRVRQRMPNCNVVLYDRLAGVGGTWRANRYPGVAVDTPAHAYTYNFESNPDLNAFFAPGPQILDYLTLVEKKYKVDEVAQYNTELTVAEWDQETGLWTLTLKRLAGEEKDTTFQDTAHFVIQATGILSEWDFPDIPGIKKFKGLLQHTAGWEEGTTDEKTWAGKRVAVVGNGASGIQVLVATYRTANNVTMYSRNQSYVLGKGDVSLIESLGMDPKDENPIFSEEIKQKFREDPALLKRVRVALERSIAAMHRLTLRGHPFAEETSNAARDAMADALKDYPDIAEKLIPSWPICCRRINPAPGYLDALKAKNVKTEWSKVAEITETGIRTEDGKFEEFDIIACATGYRNSYVPRFTVKGQNGASYKEKWADRAHHYLTVQTDEMPNWSMLMGPNSGFGTGQILMVIESGVNYAIQIAQKISRDRIKSIAVKRSSVDSFMKWMDNYFQHTNFTADCNAWYKLNNEHVVGIYPGSVQALKRILTHPRWEDFEITYDGKDEWYSLGNNFTVSERDGGETGEYLVDVDVPPIPGEDPNSWRLRFAKEPMPPLVAQAPSKYASVKAPAKDSEEAVSGAVAF